MRAPVPQIQMITILASMKSFLWPFSTYTNFHNMNMSNATEISNVADRVWKVLDFVSTMNMDLTGLKVYNFSNST